MIDFGVQRISAGQVLTQHIHIDLHIDLPKRLLTAEATYSFRIIDRDASAVILDTRGLNISSISHVSSSSDTCSSLPYKWLDDDTHAAIGNGISIGIPPNAADIFTVKIAFSTDGLGSSPAGGACDWLSPAQAGGHPFVFTQAQAIHARSLLHLLVHTHLRTTFETRPTTPYSTSLHVCPRTHTRTHSHSRHPVTRTTLASEFP